MSPFHRSSLTRFMDLSRCKTLQWHPCTTWVSLANKNVTLLAITKGKRRQETIVKSTSPIGACVEVQRNMSLSNPIPVGKWDNVNVLEHVKAQKHTCLHTVQWICECMHAYTQTHTALRWVYAWLMND